MAKQVILDERRLRIPPLTIPFELIPIEDEPPIRTSVHYPERDVQLVEVEEGWQTNVKNSPETRPSH